MGSVFAQSKGDISVKSKSKRAVTPEVARENIKSQSPIKMQFSGIVIPKLVNIVVSLDILEEELSMKRKIKEDIFDNFEEDIGILPEKTVSEVDSEGITCYLFTNYIFLSHYF